MKTLLVIAISFFSINTYSQPNIIFDTDFGGDVDDLGALAMLNHFVNKNQCILLAVMVWSNETYAVPAIDGVNTFYGNPEIPIGVRKVGKFFTAWNYSNVIADAFKHDETYETADEATSLNGKILSDNKDGNGVIVTVGPLKNIDNLVQSSADQISPLSGKELVELKVKKFVIMDGQFPEGKKEWNFDGNMPGVTKRVIENITVPFVFSGYELGVKIHIGKVLNQLDESHPLHVDYLHFSANAPWVKENFNGQILDNATYDQIAVLYAVKNGVGVYWDKIDNGINVPEDVGGNYWKVKEGSNHSYLKLKIKEEDLGHLIDAMMLGGF